MPPVVAILEPGYADYSVERRILAPLGAEVVPVAAERDAVAALEALDPIAIMVRERRVGAAEMAACPSLRAVIRYGVGVDNIDLGVASERGVRVGNVPDYGAEHEVSDHAVALYLAAARRIVSRDREVREGAWSIGQAQPMPGHRGATLGLIGYGRIARKARIKFGALGFSRVLAFDPHVDPSVLEADAVEPAALYRLCAEADCVSLHTPLTPETRGVLNGALIARLKPTAVVVNVSRGGLVDEAALAEALIAGRLHGAGLDVLEREPPDPANPLLRAPNTILSDHTAWYSESSVQELQSKAAAEALRALSGQPLMNWVNPWTS